MTKFTEKLQGILNYEGCTNFQFRGNGIGKIGTSGFILGFVGGLHFAFILLSFIILRTETLSTQTLFFIQTLIHWSLYVSCLCTFHFLEFFSTAISQPSLLSYQSYIIDHSEAYTLAALGSWTEFWVEYYIFGGQKFRIYFICGGLLLIVAGQAVRSLAMWTCGSHFSHTIMETKKKDHALVTVGIYSVLRHPAYFGWFYWSIGTQLLLCNPLCFLVYIAASWSFFSKRIPYEESLLMEFYPQTYPDYCKKTIIGIPFISNTEHVKAE